jgi:predicted ATPase
MIQIRSITVKNFKNIESADLDLNPINVIIGPNGSGKTNFLMIFSFLKIILKGANDDSYNLFLNSYDSGLGFILPKSSDSNIGCSISLSIINTDTDETINYSIDLGSVPNSFPKHVEITKEYLSYKRKSTTGSPIIIFSREGSKIKFHNKIRNVIRSLELKGYVSGMKPLELFLDNLDPNFKAAIHALTAVLDTQTLYLSPSLLKYQYQEDRNILDKRIVDFDLRKSIVDLKRSGSWLYFIDILKEITGLTDILITTLTDRGINKEFHDIDFVMFNEEHELTELSDGMILTIGLLLKIISSQNSIIILEEPENSIHPKALNSLMSFIRASSKSNQFIITTHSIALLNVLSPNEILVSSIQKNGLSTIAHISNEKDLKRKLSKGFASLGDLIFQGETEFEDIF